MFPIREIPTTVEGLLSDIRRGSLYSYARYGDGEWKSILGARGDNAGEHDWLPDLQTDLSSALLSHPTYRVATVQRFIDREFNDRGERLTTYIEAWAWLRKHGIDLEWYDQEVFADSLIQSTKERKVAPLLVFLRNLPAAVGSLLIVGPSYLEDLDEVFGIDALVRTPDRNCYLQKAEIERQILNLFFVLDKPVLCLISASMVAEVLIHDLYPLLGDQGWLIDVGSVWNPYLGRANRSYWDAMGPALQ